MRRIPPVLVALPALGLARLLPAHDAGLYLRLAAATAVVLLPGALVARALGRSSVSAAVAWAFAALFGALLVVFALRATLGLALALLGAVALAAVPFALRRRTTLPVYAGLGVFAAGIVLGIALWHLAGPLDGDALFHVARARKLDALGSLTPSRLDEFRDGGLHPGYAFPLWHAFLAAVAKLAGVDPALVVLHEGSVVAPLAVAVAYEAGRALFDAPFAGVAVAVAQVALIALAPGHGGAYRSLALPATSSRQLLAVAALALAFGAVAERDWRTLAAVAAAALGLVAVHPTYALFLLLPVGGWLVAEAVLRRRELRGIALAFGALALPTGAFLAWLAPIARQSASVHPSSAVRCGAEHGVARYADQLDVFSCHSFRLKPEALGRGGAIAVAALVLVPVAALAWRRRFAPFVLGASLAVLVLLLVPYLFTRFADNVSLSQARRMAGFLPLAFALAGGLAVAARLLRFAVLPAALAAGIALQLLWPGDFAQRLAHGGPPLAVWIAAFGGGATLLAAALVRRPRLDEDGGWLVAAAAALFVLPVAVHGFSEWTPATPPSGQTLSAGLLRALHARVPRGDVVLSDPETSYRIAAFAPVYLVAAPPPHVADTKANRPYERAKEVARYFKHPNGRLLRRYDVHWIVVDRKRERRVRLRLRRVYADRRYELYKT